MQVNLRRKVLNDLYALAGEVQCARYAIANQEDRAGLEGLKSARFKLDQTIAEIEKQPELPAENPRSSQDAAERDAS
jgi:hypothetical protein